MRSPDAVLMQTDTHLPVSAAVHTSLAGNRVRDAASLVTVYIVLLFAVPSNVTISSMGSMGRPAMLWGLVLLVFWVVSRLQWRATGTGTLSQPVRMALAAYVVVVLVSFAAAMLRGQPTDQISPAITSVIGLLSCVGVLLVIVDGVTTMRDVTRLMRRIAIGVFAMALLALAQTVTQQSLLEFWGSIPGFSLGSGGVTERNGQIRASATATHPLEFVAALNATLPICIAAAMTDGFRTGASRVRGLRWWLVSATIMIVALTGLSRSAIIGFAVAVITMIPAVPRRLRGVVVGGGVVVMVGLVAAVPGLAGTTARLFTGAADDTSTLSRTDALARLGEFMSPSPLVGVGYGTFLPRYYIFDNQWAMTAIELGVLGIIAFVSLIVAGVWSAWDARGRSDWPDTRLAGHALAAAVVNLALAFAFFDGMSFAISSGLLFVFLGLCAAIRTVAVAGEGAPEWDGGAPRFQVDVISAAPPVHASRAGVPRELHERSSSSS